MSDKTLPANTTYGCQNACRSMPALIIVHPQIAHSRA
jgi:hypothetical protein